MPAHRDLIDYAATLRYATLPPDVIAETKRMILDTLACIVAARATETAPAIALAADFLGTGVAAQAYRYARYADLMDYNEGYAGAHFGCGAIAAALVLGRQYGTSGTDVLTAVTAGFEVGARVMDAIGPYYNAADHRFLPVWGITAPVSYAAVGAAVNLLGLRDAKALEAFSLAGSYSPIPVGGIWSNTRELPNTKYGDAGWATLAGVMAAVCAQGGSTGLTDLLNNNNGLLKILGAANANPAALCADLGTGWRSRHVLYKHWPCCGLIYGVLQLAEGLIARHAICAQDVQQIRVHVSAAIFIPRFVNNDPTTQVSLQFSVPHNLAMLIADIPNGPLWQSATVAARPDIVRLRQTVTCMEYCPTPAHPDGVCAIDITTPHATYTSTLDGHQTRRGNFDGSDTAIIAKCRRLVSDPQASVMVDHAMQMETLNHLDTLIEALEQARCKNA